MTPLPCHWLSFWSQIKLYARVEIVVVFGTVILPSGFQIRVHGLIDLFFLFLSIFVLDHSLVFLHVHGFSLQRPLANSQHIGSSLFGGRCYLLRHTHCVEDRRWGARVIHWLRHLMMSMIIACALVKILLICSTVCMLWAALADEVIPMPF